MRTSNHRPATLALLGALALSGALLSCDGPTAPGSPVPEEELRTLEAGVPDSILARYRDDASRLALREVARLRPLAGAPVELPAPLVRSTYRALLAVHGATALPPRDSVVEVFRIHTFPNPVLREIIVAPAHGAPWVEAWRKGRTLTGAPAVDALITRYQLGLRRFYDFSFGPTAVLASDSAVNTAALAAAFAALPDVRFAEPNGMGGDGHDIRAERLRGGWRLEYSVGFGDCPAGCIGRHTWTFEVGDAGGVSYRGSSGPPVPGG